MIAIDPETDLTKRALLPAGLRDVLPPEAAHEASVVEALIACFTSHGYDRVKPPLVEFEDSLFAGPGAAMTENTFRLMDPLSQRMMGLRADTTVQIARMAATRLSHHPRPLRLCYAGEVLRITGGQLNPERQLVQVGAELIGADSPRADAETILLAVEALRSAGVDPITVDINAPLLVPTLLDAHGIDVFSARNLLAAIDRKEVARVSSLAAELGEPDLGICLARLMTTAADWRTSLDRLSQVSLPPSASDVLDRLRSTADLVLEAESDLALTLDPVEHRGFEYYAGLGFSVFSRGVRGELGRGGRYFVDGTSGESSTGFTLYMETVMRAVPDAGAAPRAFAPAVVSADARAAARAAGWVV